MPWHRRNLAERNNKSKCGFGTETLGAAQLFKGHLLPARCPDAYRYLFGKLLTDSLILDNFRTIVLDSIKNLHIFTNDIVG